MAEISTSKLNGVFEIDETYENNNWLKAQIRTFAFGKNQNGSDILNSSLTDFSKARKSIGAVPIVAKYNDDTDNLEGHNAMLRKNKDDEYEIYHDTDALGFTSPTTNFHFEEVNEGTEEFPDYKTYVVIEEVYLWKRFDATKKIIDWSSEGISPRVSMEIGQVEGQFDNEGYFQISDFEFTGIAALGTDIEPCFKKAEIQLYTVNEFKEDLKTLMSELNYSTTQEGGNSMTDTIETQAEETEVFEATVETEEAVAEETVEQPEAEAVEEAPEENFEAPETEKEDEVEEAKNEEETFEQEEAKEAVVEQETPIDYEVKFNDLNSEFATIQAELKELREYKRSREESDLQSQFANKLSEDEFTQIFESMKEKEMSEVEEKLYALIGKKNFSATKPTTQVNKIALGLPKEDEVVKSPYGGLFDKYNN